MNKDPTQLAVLRAIVSCHFRLSENDRDCFGWDIGSSLAQQSVCFHLSIFIGRGGSALLNSFQVRSNAGSTLLSLSTGPYLWGLIVGDVTEKNQ